MIPGTRGVLTSAVVTTASSPFVRRVLLRLGQLDRPNERSSHSDPTPRGGGIACLAGVLTTAISSRLTRHRVATPVLVGATVLAVEGLRDDRASLGAGERLGVQAVVGAAVAGWQSGSAPGALVGAVATPAVVNATNFMDGVNGISAMTAAVWGFNAMAVGRHCGRHDLLGLGAMTAGAALGFLPWNAPTAQLFLGDVGSYLFGGLFAGGLESAPDRASVLLLAAPLSVYGTDTAVTLARRAAQGQQLTAAHREHAYQRLVSEGGLTHWQSASIAAATALQVTAVEWTSLPQPAKRAAQAGTLATYVALPTLLKRVRLGGAGGNTP